MVGRWQGDTTHYLMIIPTGSEPVEIDLDERGWIDRLSKSGVMKAPGTWYLVRKAGNSIVAMLLVKPGEEPYYLKRHVGFTTNSANRETAAFGIGKKRLDGHVDRIWVMEKNGVVVTGDDLEPIALDLLKRGLI